MILNSIKIDLIENTVSLQPLDSVLMNNHEARGEFNEYF